MQHPNATTAAGTGGLSVFVVWLLGHFHVALSAEDGAVIAGALATVVLFVGRNGIKGLWRKLWNGQQGTADTVVLLLVAILIVALFVAYKVH